ncbi:MAG TPA: hypothetical protein VLM40_07425, partial [Gemmata sp.]|nr:hypothetical protein [Gemmata sp.]
MPIRFRCGYCSRLLAIARRKAGTTTTCPHCGAIIGVPPPEEFEHRQAPRQELADIDRLLKADQAANGAPTSSSQATAATLAADGFSTTPSSASGTPTPPPSVLTTPGPAAPTRDPVIPTRRPVQIDHEKPLFERDVEDVLGSR